MGNTKIAAGCAVCNPTPQRSTEGAVRERQAELEASMHIVRMADGLYHVVSIPGFDGEPVHAWPGPWETEAAASLFMDDLLDAYAQGSPGDACCSSGISEHLNLAGRLLAFIERHDGSARSLARALARDRPWKTAEPELEFSF